MRDSNGRIHPIETLLNAHDVWVEWHIEEDGFAFVTSHEFYYASIVDLCNEIMRKHNISMRFILDC